MSVSIEAAAPTALLNPYPRRSNVMTRYRSRSRSWRVNGTNSSTKSAVCTTRTACPDPSALAANLPPATGTHVGVMDSL